MGDTDSLSNTLQRNNYTKSDLKSSRVESDPFATSYVEVWIHMTHYKKDPPEK